MTSLITLNQHENYDIIASLKGEPMGKLINRIPGSRFLISSLPGSALRTLVESPGKPRKPRDVNKRSQSLAWKTRYQKTRTWYSIFINHGLLDARV